MPTKSDHLMVLLLNLWHSQFRWLLVWLGMMRVWPEHDPGTTCMTNVKFIFLLSVMAVCSGFLQKHMIWRSPVLFIAVCKKVGATCLFEKTKYLCHVWAGNCFLLYLTQYFEYHVNLYRSGILKMGPRCLWSPSVKPRRIANFMQVVHIFTVSTCWTRVAASIKNLKHGVHS